jgi:hypothetical protein
MSEVVLIDTGVYQDYITYNINNLKLFGNEITVITDTNLCPKFYDLDVNIISTEVLDTSLFEGNNHLEGFWANTSKRLFLLFSYLKKFNKKNVIHIENDYLIYCNTQDLKFETFMYLTMDSITRCIPGIMYIPDYTFMEPLFKDYRYQLTDMFNLGLFYNRWKNKFVKKISIYPDQGDTSFIFDAAAIGQYLGGIDPIHAKGATPGFINETCTIDYSKYTFHWIQNLQGLQIPNICIGGIDYPVLGLHIHSKNLKNFMSDDPLEDRLINKHCIKF